MTPVSAMQLAHLLLTELQKLPEDAVDDQLLQQFREEIAGFRTKVHRPVNLAGGDSPPGRLRLSVREGHPVSCYFPMAHPFDSKAPLPSQRGLQPVTVTGSIVASITRSKDISFSHPAFSNMDMKHIPATRTPG